MKRDYIDGPFGQLHVLEWGSDKPGAPIICLAPAPFSSVAYQTLAPLLGEKRRVIAVDYPGYGSSDSVSYEPSIADYSDGIAAVANAVSGESTVDLLGFHTGCLVAGETSLRHPQLVNQLLLIDVPFFNQERQLKLLDEMNAKPPIGTDVAVLNQAWNFCVVKKVEHISLGRAYENFIDYIAKGEKSKALFNAAFHYACHERFSEIKHPTCVIATNAGLYDESCLTAKIVKGAQLIEIPQVTVAVLDKGAPIISQRLFDHLDI